MTTTYFSMTNGRRSEPSDAEKQELFNAWFDSDRHQAYRQARAAGGGALLDRADAYALFCRRWQRPQSPAGLAQRTLTDINRHAFNPAA
ncbi:hypothetical protein OG203_24620 [Nocardia sp. NBC_01499]|uniref:hypothetical protein n=1 Tax=Nocardia sp. NBC_01499 TaxID=2903597 RepID=UPI0038689A6F